MVTKYILQLEKYFDLMQLSNNNLRANSAKTLLLERARTWYAMQQYNLARFTQTDLVDDLQTTFQLTHFACQAREQLTKAKLMSTDIVEYVP